MTQTTRDIDLTSTYFLTLPMSLERSGDRTVNSGSMQLTSAGETEIAGSPVWTLQTSDDQISWVAVSGGALTGAGMLQSLDLPSTGWVRAQLTTKSATATDRGHFTIKVTEQSIH